MIGRLVAKAALMVILATAAHAQQAGTFSFTYTFGSTDTFQAVLTGSMVGGYFTATGLQSSTLDGNAVTLSSAPFSLPPFVESDDFYSGLGSGHNGDGTPVLTLNGSYEDIASFNFGSLIFAIDQNNIVGGLESPKNVINVFNAPSGIFISNVYETFNTNSWRASFQPDHQDIPEPAGLVILAAGIVGLGLARAKNAF